MMTSDNTLASQAQPRARIEWLVVALLMVAFALRMIDLERRPLHFDEGINVTLGHRSPADVLSISRATFDNDPPGHRFAMGVWMSLAGPSPLAIRIFSIFFSLLAVAVLYRLLRLMRLPFLASLIATAILACSPYAIDYAQQAKGYAMGAGTAMLSWWMWVVMFEKPKQRGARDSGALRQRAALVLYVVCTALALSTHYYTLFLLPMQWLWFAGTRLELAKRGAENPISVSNIVRVVAERLYRRQVLRGIVAQAIACVPIGIWLLLMWQSLQVSTARSSTKFQPVLPIGLLSRILGEMSAGQFVVPAIATLCALVVTVGAVIGAGCLWRGSGHENGSARTRNAFWFGLALLVPLAGAVALTQRVTFFFPRFLVYALPNLCVLIAGCFMPWARSRGARNATVVMQRAAAVAIAAFLVAGTLAFRQAPIDTADDYGPLVAEVRPLIKNGDAALGTYIWMEGMFTSYAPETTSSLQWYEESYGPDTVDRLLAPIVREHARIWSLNYLRNPDAPDTLSIQWLKRTAAYADRFTWGATSVLLFDTRDPPQADTLREATFGNMIRLDYGPSSQQVAPGDTMIFTLKWSALRPLTDHFAIFLHLLAPDGRLVAQQDGDAVNGLAPDFTWETGKPIFDRRALLIPAALPRGNYTLVLGMYRQPDGSRLITGAGGDAVQIATVHVSR